MNRKLVSAAVLVSLLVLTSAVEAQNKVFKPPADTKVAAGKFFEVYVLKKHEEPAWAGTNFTRHQYEVVFVVQTRKRGTRGSGIQRQPTQVTALDADLLNPKSWEIADLDGDGLEDYRVLKQIWKGGCQDWDARLWNAKRESFTTAGSFAFVRSVNAKGKQVANCFQFPR